jgi:hypothetical protein
MLKTGMRVITEYKVGDGILIAAACIIHGFDGKVLKALLVKKGI